MLTFQANPSLPGRFSFNNVSALYQDRAGTLWVGTSAGINCVTAHSKQFQTYQLKPTPPSVFLPEHMIPSLVEDPAGTIWLANAGDVFDGNFQNGLFRFEPNTQQAKPVPAHPTDPWNCWGELSR